MWSSEICVELRGNLTIRSVADCMSSLDRLLAELSKDLDANAASSWPIWDMHAEAGWVTFQARSVYGDAAADPDYIAAWYLSVLQMLGLGRPTGLSRAVEDAALDLLSAVRESGGRAGFLAYEFWLDIDLSDWNRHDVLSPFPMTGWFTGDVIDVRGGDRPYAVVRSPSADEYRCYLSAEQLEEARDGLKRPVYVSGTLAVEPGDADQIAIRPTNVFDAAGHPQARERMQARRVELGLPGATL